MIDDKFIVLVDIQVLLFVVGIVKDYVVFWQLVYKVNLFIDKDIMFLLINGGYNVGIISELGYLYWVYQVVIKKEDGFYLLLQVWLKDVFMYEGLWWLVWQ